MKKVAWACSLLLALINTATFAANPGVTVYGKLDVGYGTSNGGDIEGREGNASKFQQWGNGYASSRWGFEGKEDLDNGLQVYFHLESAFNPENGASKGFNRRAIVGMSSDSWGTVELGRQDATYDRMLSDFSLSGDPTLTCANCNAGISSGQRASRYNSAATYISPDWSGFSFQAQFVSKNDEAGVNNQGDKNLYAVGATYHWQALTLGAAYESKPISSHDVSTSWGVAAKYDFKSFVLAGGYFDNHYKNDGKGFYMGATTMPIENFRVGVQVAYNVKAYIAGREKIKPLAWQLFGFYDLSKRTSLYALYGAINNDAKTFASALRKYSFTTGLIHTF